MTDRIGMADDLRPGLLYAIQRHEREALRLYQFADDMTQHPDSRREARASANMYSRAAADLKAELSRLASEQAPRPPCPGEGRRIDDSAHLARRLTDLTGRPWAWSLRMWGVTDGVWTVEDHDLGWWRLTRSGDEHLPWMQQHLGETPRAFLHRVAAAVFSRINLDGEAPPCP